MWDTLIKINQKEETPGREVSKECEEVVHKRRKTGKEDLLIRQESRLQAKEIQSGLVQTGALVWEEYSQGTLQVEGKEGSARTKMTLEPL